MTEQRYDPKACDIKHRPLYWLSGATLTLVAVLVGLAGWAVVAGQHATERADAASARADKAVDNTSALLSVQNQRVQDNWDSTQRQVAALNTSLRDLKESMDKSNASVLVELKENRSLLMEVVRGQRAPCASPAPEPK